MVIEMMIKIILMENYLASSYARHCSKAFVK